MYHLKFGKSKNYIVFLHGWGADHNSFLWCKNYFENDYSLIFVDFDGFGKSAEPQYVYNLDDFVFNLKKLLDNFAIENLTIIGHSFGGRVAIKFANYFNDKYKNLRLVLVDSAGLFSHKRFITKLKILKYKFFKFLYKHKLIKSLSNFGSNDYKTLSPIMKKSFSIVVNENLKIQAKKIKNKTLIVWGNKDKETPLYMAKKFKRYIRNSKLVVFKNVGHFSFLENKKDFLINLDSFLKNQ